MMRLFLCTVSVCLVVGTAGTSFANEKNPAREKKMQSAEEFTTKLGKSIHYLLYLPTGYQQNASWPLLLFLHGAGERGDNLDKVTVHGPPMLVKQGKSFPLIIVSPQCPQGSHWSPEDLLELLDSLNQKYKVDPNRVYVSGLSMGGYGTWALLALAPDRFAAAIPICGGGNPSTAAKFSHVPVWVFHGAKDPTVPVKKSADMVDALKQAGSTVKFTVYPEAGHNSWTATYNNPEVWSWLLAQKRKGG